MSGTDAELLAATTAGDAEAFGGTLGERIGVVEPMREAVEPCRVVIRESTRRRRPPQRLAQAIASLHEKPSVSVEPGGTQASHVPLSWALDLGLLWRPGFRRIDQVLRYLPKVARPCSMPVSR